MLKSSSPVLFSGCYPLSTDDLPKAKALEGILSYRLSAQDQEQAQSIRDAFKQQDKDYQQSPVAILVENIEPNVLMLITGINAAVIRQLDKLARQFNSSSSFEVNSRVSEILDIGGAKDDLIHNMPQRYIRINTTGQEESPKVDSVDFLI